MRRAAMALLLAAGALTMTAAAPAVASSGDAVVFSTEFQPLTHYVNPQGCESLPPFAHVIDNLTDRPIRIYTGRGCLGPSLEISPDHGSHVSPVGSFRAP